MKRKTHYYSTLFLSIFSILRYAKRKYTNKMKNSGKHQFTSNITIYNGFLQSLKRNQELDDKDTSSDLLRIYFLMSQSSSRYRMIFIFLMCSSAFLYTIIWSNVFYAKTKFTQLNFYFVKRIFYLNRYQML